MAGSDLVYVLEEIVKVIETLDTLVQGVHYVVRVLRQLHRVDLFLLRSTLAEFFEHIQ